MPLRVFANVRLSGSVPENWIPDAQSPLKYPVRNQKLLRHLRSLLSGRWRKVIKTGNTGEVHYFEHSSGSAAGVKFYPKQP